MLKLSHAADEVAAGRYGVEVPQNAAGEIGHLAERFGDMAVRLAEAEALERNFLMSVSHELRTPLTAIRGHVSALQEGLAADPELREHSLAIVEAEAQRLERLVGDILDLAKLDAHRFTVMREEIDMESLLERAYETFTEEARQRSIDYRVEVRARPVIVSDGDRVLQIVGNLLSNAFKATPDGGRIADERRRARRRRGHRARHRGGAARAALPAVRLRGDRRDRARAGDRERALAGARRADRPRLRGRPRLALRARPADGLAGVGGAEGDDVRRRRDGALDPLEALVRRAPVRGDQVDEQREVVDTRVPFCGHVPLEALEAADRLVDETLDLSEAARDRRGLLAQPVTERTPDGVGEHRLQLVGRLRERLHLQPRALERGGDVGRERVPVIHLERR